MTEQRIRVLDHQTINQIAAGEVIENPSSVIKELIENALDAKSTIIKVITQAGGRGLIRVSDDGCGMSPDELLLSLERHATSKLLSVEGLGSLETLGFRGEALPSIASVSKMYLHSALRDGEGYRVSVVGGKVGRLEPLARLPGTTIEVRSLFFNTPVRKKFQKSLAWDKGEIHRILTKFALSYPSVAFIWESDDQEQFNFPASTSLKERLQILLGEEISQNMLPVEHMCGPLKLVGFISDPSLHRPHRIGQHLFINKRGVTSTWASQRILEGYGTRLPPHRYPLFVISMTLPSAWIDVNVHPQKREIRMREEEKIAPFIREAITRGLEQNALIASTIATTFPSLQILPPLLLNEPLSLENWVSRETTYEDVKTRLHHPYESTLENPIAAQTTVLHKEERSGTIWLRHPISIIAHLKHFLLMQEVNGIRVVNTHYALERVIYEALCSNHEKQSIQTLLFPLQMTFVGKEKQMLNEHLESLNRIGINIRHFGGNTYIIDAIPSILEISEISDLIYAYLEEGVIPQKVGKCLKPRTLSKEEGSVLIERLFNCSNPHQTPDGKTIHTLLDEKTLEKCLKFNDSC